MVIRFHIPGGEMAVEAAVFFREARMWQIRRMLKMYRESGSGGEYRSLSGSSVKRLPVYGMSSGLYRKSMMQPCAGCLKRAA